jgi:hypothetical protein
MQVGQGTPNSHGHLDRSTEDNQDGIVLSRTVATGPVGRGTAHYPHHDTIGDGLGKGYSQDSEMGDDKDSFGHEAIGTSPLFSDKSIPGGCGQDSALANATQESTPPQAHHVRHSQPLEVEGANVSQPVQVQGGNNERADGSADADNVSYLSKLCRCSNMPMGLRLSFINSPKPLDKRHIPAMTSDNHRKVVYS